MKILFDVGVPWGLRRYLPDHEVSLPQKIGFGTTVDGELLRRAEPPSFDVFVSTDGQFRSQQNLAGRRLAILIIKNFGWPHLRHVAAQVAELIVAMQPGEYREFVVPEVPRPPRSRR